MTLTHTTVIVVITVIISFIALQNQQVMGRLIFSSRSVRDLKQYDRFVTHGFVHADMVHLAFNMITLYFFGGFIESFYLSRFGSLGFVSFYVLAIVVSMIPSYLEHRHSKDYLSLGASGVVSAVIFVAILFKPWQMLYLFAILPIPAIVFAIAYIAYGVYAHKKGSRRINHLAHLAGAAFGVIATILIEPKLIGDFLYELTHPRFF